LHIDGEAEAVEGEERKKVYNYLIRT